MINRNNKSCGVTTDICIDQGTDFLRVLTIKDSNGDPIDLTGFSFASQARKRFSDSSPILTFSFSITDAAGGVVEWTLAKEITEALDLSSPLELFYDVEMNSGSRVTRILQGKITVEPEVTK